MRDIFKDMGNVERNELAELGAAVATAVAKYADKFEFSRDQAIKRFTDMMIHLCETGSIKNLGKEPEDFEDDTEDFENDADDFENVIHEVISFEDSEFEDFSKTLITSKTISVLFITSLRKISEENGINAKSFIQSRLLMMLVALSKGDIDFLIENIESEGEDDEHD